MTLWGWKGGGPLGGIIDGKSSKSTNMDGDGQMAQLLRARTFPAEDLGLVPRTHTVVHNCLHI